MITNKDIRVENGFLIINGDKYPLDGQSPEAIMQIVEDNSDTTPTENSDAPITSGGVFAADKAISDTIATINSSLLPIDAVVKRFSLDANTTIDTGINVNNKYSTGFMAIVSSHSSTNGGRMNIYIGGVAYQKQDGTVGDLNSSKLGGVALGVGTAGDNLSFSISNDNLQITAPQGQDRLSVTLILSKR